MSMHTSKSALADTYHTTGIRKPTSESFKHGYKPVYIDYGVNAPAGDPVFKDPDCRYVEFFNSANERVVGLKKWADDPAIGVCDDVKWFDVTTNKTVTIHVDRKSHSGHYKFGTITKLPYNPLGLTGVSGPGKLGRFGPNHAVDPIVGYKCGDVYRFVAIRRRDTGEWAFPGGMIDPEECVTATLKREFGEEAGGTLCPELCACFDKAVKVYSGPVDDPRNTDNAWMETVAKFVDVSNVPLEKLKLVSGSDATDVAWAAATLVDDTLVVKVRDNNVVLYASHASILRQALPLFRC